MLSGQITASSNELTHNSNYCWEYTELGFGSGPKVGLEGWKIPLERMREEQPRLSCVYLHG